MLDKLPGPTVDVMGFMTDPMNLNQIKAILAEALEFLEVGKGKYDTDGTFHPKDSTLGLRIDDPIPAHRLIRTHLLVTAVYAQGLSYVFDKLTERGLAAGREDTSMAFEEDNMNRSLMLMNQHYKARLGHLGAGYVTLSALTCMALTDTPRNRQRLRDKVAPVMAAHGLWIVESADGKRANFSAGPLLVQFSDFVLGRMKPFDGAAA